MSILTKNTEIGRKGTFFHGWIVHFSRYFYFVCLPDITDFQHVLPPQVHFPVVEKVDWVNKVLCYQDLLHNVKCCHPKLLNPDDVFDCLLCFKGSVINRTPQTAKNARDFIPNVCV